MSEPISPSLLLLAAVMVGTGLYLIQRGRFVVPLLMRRFPPLRERPRLARGLLLVLMTLGIAVAGTGCRIVITWFRV